MCVAEGLTSLPLPIAQHSDSVLSISVSYHPMQIVGAILSNSLSLLYHIMQIVDTILSSTTVLIANKSAWEDPLKRAKIEDVALLLMSAIEGRKKVGLKMNLHKDNLEQVGVPHELALIS